MSAAVAAAVTTIVKCRQQQGWDGGEVMCLSDMGGLLCCVESYNELSLTCFR